MEQASLQPPSVAAPRRPDRLLGWVLLGLALLTALRLVFAAAIPLTEDEAYYRLWAIHPQFGYYDHPPMVAWWLALGRWLVGDTPLGARLVPVLASAVAGVLIYDIAQLAGLSGRTAARAVAWYNAAPLVGFGALLILPDDATTLFWCLTLWALLKSERTGQGGWGGGGWWVLAGAAAGCAALSKYSALFLGPGVLWWLLRSVEGRRKLMGPWPWVALLIAGGLFMTNVAWNAGHQWITFAKQFGRVAPHGFKPLGPLTFLLVLVLLSNPLMTPFLARALRTRVDLKSAARVDDPARGLDLVFISAIPFFAYLCLHSLHADVEAHWPAPLYPSLAILAAAGAQGRLGPGMRRLAAAAPVVGFALSTLALIHMATPQTDGLWRRDPSHPLRGWTPFARAVGRLRVAHGAAWIGTVSYGTYAQLEDHQASGHPMLQVTERRRYLFAPPPSPSVLKQPGLIVDLSRRMSMPALFDCFAQVTPIATLPRGDAVRGDIYTVVKVSGPKRDVGEVGCRSFHNGKADD